MGGRGAVARRVQRGERFGDIQAHRGWGFLFDILERLCELSTCFGPQVGANATGPRRRDSMTTLPRKSEDSRPRRFEATP
jgi:hypothetical protein